jgi:hypothetical protein
MNHRHDYQASKYRLRCSTPIAGYTVQTLPGALSNVRDCHISWPYFIKFIRNVKNNNSKLFEIILK